MRKEEFIKELYAAGWVANCDAQHSEIEKLWRKLFPVVADLEDELTGVIKILEAERKQHDL